MKSLSGFCAAFWAKGRQDINDYCDAIDLYTLIAGYQSQGLLPTDETRLLRCVICKNSKVRKVWRSVRIRIVRELSQYYQSRELRDRRLAQWMECCSVVMEAQVRRCLAEFDLCRARSRANKDLLNLISAYVAGSVHHRQTVRDLGLEALRPHLGQSELEAVEYRLPDDSPSAEQALILEDGFERVVLREKGLQQAIARHNLLDYIQETATGQNPKSNRARQQKARLKKFFLSRWKLEEPLLSYVLEKLEWWIEQGRIDARGEIHDPAE